MFKTDFFYLIIKDIMETKEKNKIYMRAYVANSPVVTCDECGHTYKAYAKYKHLATKRHQQSNIMELPLAQVQIKLPAKKINLGEIMPFLEKHFEESVNPARHSANRTVRSNKNASLWRKLSPHLLGRTWEYLGKNIGKIIGELYDKPSSQADLAQMIKLISLQFNPDISDSQFTILVRKLKTQHLKIEPAVDEMPGLTYDELKTKENDDDKTLALLARLYSRDMIPLRIGDYLNSSTLKKDGLNWMNLNKYQMIRTIKKNQQPDTYDVIPLPEELCRWMKVHRPKGILFHETVAKIDTIMKKAFPERKATPHYFRSLYATEIAPTLSEDELRRVLPIMDHSITTNVAYYNKGDKSALLKLLSE